MMDEFDETCSSVSSEMELPELLPAYEENEDFIFETDSYALQNNKDYQDLLNCLFRLESQRIYVTKALEEIKVARRKVREDPLGFVELLQNGKIDFKPRISIAEVPNIDMSKYDITSYIESMRPNTRKSTRETSFASVSKPTESNDELDKKIKPKSATFNIAWTPEEQRRLEELLIKYPDEPIASKRYAKIAKELGTRTLMQVQSRVQKYFIALKKEGLPVPGRDPKTAMLRNTRKRPYSNHVSASTKFMKAFDFGDSADHSASLPVVMKNEKDQLKTSKISEPIRLKAFKKKIRKVLVKKKKVMDQHCQMGLVSEKYEVNPQKEKQFETVTPSNVLDSHSDSSAS